MKNLDTDTTVEGTGNEADVDQTAQYLFDDYYSFLRAFKVDKKQYIVNHYTLKDVATRYWRDVERLHRFHNMPRIDCYKIAGYLAYWICKLQPIQVINNLAYLTNTETPRFINETFAVYVVCGRINADLIKEGYTAGIVLHDKTINHLLYTLKYRVTSGDMLSLFFEAIESATVQKKPQSLVQSTSSGVEAPIGSPL